MTQISHSSTNSRLNHYAKFNFQGTKEVQEAQKNVRYHIKCKPLTSPVMWEIFCIHRKFYDL